MTIFYVKFTFGRLALILLTSGINLYLVIFCRPMFNLPKRIDILETQKLANSRILFKNGVFFKIYGTSDKLCKILKIKLN